MTLHFVYYHTELAFPWLIYIQLQVYAEALVHGPLKEPLYQFISLTYRTSKASTDGKTFKLAARLTL